MKVEIKSLKHFILSNIQARYFLNLGVFSSLQKFKNKIFWRQSQVAPIPQGAVYLGEYTETWNNKIKNSYKYYTNTYNEYWEVSGGGYVTYFSTTPNSEGYVESPKIFSLFFREKSLKYFKRATAHLEKNPVTGCPITRRFSWGWEEIGCIM